MLGNKIIKGGYIPDAAAGAGNTGNTVPPSQLGPVGKEKLIIVDDVYSGNGTDIHRLSGDYALGRGGADDIFRDFLGKVWIKTDAAMGNFEKLEFLNPKMGVGSANVPMNLPCEVYVDAAQLVKDEVWPEFSQKIFIDPDPHWLYDKLVPAFFPNKDFDVEVKNVVVQALRDPAEGFVGLDSAIAQDATTILTKIRDAWMEAFKFENSSDALTNITGITSALINYGPSYFDYNFVISTPFKTEDAGKLLGLKPLIANLNPEYNFYINEYECLLNDKGVKEQIIPNIYAFISSYIPENYGNDIHKTSKKFEDLISLNYLLQGYDGSSLVTTPYKFGQAQTLIPMAANNYYRAWATTINRADPDSLRLLTPLAKRYSNILFPMRDTGMLKYYNNLKFMFPMYNELKFSTGILTQFGDLMRSTKLAQHFMRYYVTVSDLIGDLGDITTDSSFVKKAENFLIQESEVGGVFNNVLIDRKEMTVMSLEAWLATMELLDLIPDSDDMITLSTTRAHDELFNENAVFMTTNKNEDLINVESSNKLERSILAAILFGRARKVAKSNIRHYGDLCQGKTAYSETLMYKVEKFNEGTDRVSRVSRGGERNGNKIQTFYFLNSSEIDVLKFIDTQVSYNTRYIYKISAVQLVLGTEYRYDTAPQFASEKSKKGAYLNLWQSEEAKAAKETYGGTPGGEGGSSAVSAVGGASGLPFHDPIYVAAAMASCNSGPVVSPDNPYFGLKDPCGCAKILIKENLEMSAAKYCEQNPGSPCCPDIIPANESNTFPGGDPSNGGGGSFGGGGGPGGGSGGGGGGAAATPGVMILPEGGTSLLTSIPVVYKPNYNIVEVPYTTVEGRILDKPPVFPDVNIVPYKGINNNLLVNLNSQVGEYDMIPVAFNGEEEKEIALLKEAQKVTGDDKPIKYKSDDTIAYGGFFQVYRMEKRPETYKDFDKHLKQTIRTKVGLLYSEAAAFVDDIKPNKKYYYTFRVMDVHGNLSNPTEVFEVEIIDDNGTVYIRQRVIELKPIEDKVPYVPLKKYIQIKPILAQRVLDEYGMDLANAESAFEYSSTRGSKGPPKLGMKEESVWGKKFKIRFTSKSTGKQIDLNVNFVVTGDDALEKIGNQLQDASAVQGIRSSAGGLVNPIDMEKSGQPGKPLEGM